MHQYTIQPQIKVVDVVPWAGEYCKNENSLCFEHQIMRKIP